VFVDDPAALTVGALIGLGLAAIVAGVAVILREDSAREHHRQDEQHHDRARHVHETDARLGDGDPPAGPAGRPGDRGTADGGGDARVRHRGHGGHDRQQ
jgi:hypothetical protein